MVSEAASSGKYIVVFKPKYTRPSKHALFLKDLAKGGYINLIEINELEGIVKKIFYSRPKVKVLDNKNILREAINRLF
jgi:mitochondrial fission protein ELM1